MQPGGNLPSLTSLRFFAAAMVAGFHASKWINEGVAADGVVRFGFVGVTFFYVLSGFVLAWTWKPHEPTRLFYLRRFARVWPSHFLAAILALTLGAAGLIHLDASPVSVPLNLLLVQSWHPDPAVVFSLNGPAWSLSDEAFFYAVFPLLIVRVPKRPRLAIAAAVVWLAVIGIVFYRLLPDRRAWLNSVPAYRVGEFIVGIALASMVRAGVRLLWPVWTAAVVPVLCYLAQWPVDALTHGRILANMWASELMVLPGFAVLIWTAASRDLAGHPSLLHARPLVKLGQWSFALYLLHELALRAAEPVLDGPAAWPLAIGVLLVAQAAAAAMYEWYERPVERRIRAWAHQRESVIATSA